MRSDEHEIDAIAPTIGHCLAWVAKGLFFGIGFYIVQAIAERMA